MQRFSGVLAMAALAAAAAFGSGCATGGGASIDGTYRLVSRDMPDGTKVTPPEVGGCLSLTGTVRNFNVYWKTEDGRTFSLASVGRYWFDGTRYTEQNVYYMISDPAQNAVAYDFSSEKRTAEVSEEGGRYRFVLPLHDEPEVVFGSNGFTATREGEFVDHWKRVE